MSESAPKQLFKRQSGQMKAVSEESKEILEMTKAIAEQVKSDPPPPISAFPLPPPRLQRPKTPGVGMYTVLPGGKSVKKKASDDR